MDFNFAWVYITYTPAVLALVMLITVAVTKPSFFWWATASITVVSLLGLFTYEVVEYYEATIWSSAKLDISSVKDETLTPKVLQRLRDPNGALELARMELDIMQTQAKLLLAAVAGALMFRLKRWVNIGSSKGAKGQAHAG